MTEQSLGICPVCSTGQLQRDGADLVCPNHDFKIHEADWYRLWELYEPIKHGGVLASDWLVNKLQEYNLVKGKDVDNDSP